MQPPAQSTGSPLDRRLRLGYPAGDVIQIFGTPKCKLTRAAQRFFADRRIKVQFVDLRDKGLSKGELSSVARAVGGVRALYDAASPRVKERGLQYAAPTDARLMELLVDDPLLVRTPIVRDGARATVGDDEATWKAFAEAARPG
ncbi:MAG TPA: ArsC/Spx/MgsR family protein [Candidatus Nanopelagicales bacterium]|nr:ArsC/Spx/MgsR family protein [Candidatus Nanopelagicales bacterium]